MIDSKDSSRHWQNLSLMFFCDEWEETSCDIFGSSQNIFGGVRLCQSRPQLINHSFFPLCASATKDTFRRQVNLSTPFFHDPFESILMNERKLPAISSEVTKISSEVSGGVNRGDHSHPQNTHSIHRITLLVHYLQH